MEKDRLIVSIQPTNTSNSSQKELAEKFAHTQNGVHQWSVNHTSEPEGICLYLWKGNGVSHMRLNKAFTNWAEKNEDIADSEIHDYEKSIRD